MNPGGGEAITPLILNELRQAVAAQAGTTGLTGAEQAAPWLVTLAERITLRALAARATAAPDDLAEAADEITRLRNTLPVDTRAALALTRADYVLRTHRCSPEPLPEVATPAGEGYWTPGPWLMPGECLDEACAAREVSHRHSAPAAPPADEAGSGDVDPVTELSQVRDELYAHGCEPQRPGGWRPGRTVALVREHLRVLDLPGADSTGGQS